MLIIALILHVNIIHIRGNQLENCSIEANLPLAGKMSTNPISLLSNIHKLTHHLLDKTASGKIILSLSNKTLVFVVESIESSQQQRLYEMINNLTMSIMFVNSKSLHFGELEIFSKTEMLYIICESFLKRPLIGIISTIRDSGGTSPILIISDYLIRMSIFVSIETSVYFNIFAAVLRENGFAILEKCAFCFNGNHAMKQRYFWSLENKIMDFEFSLKT